MSNILVRNKFDWTKELEKTVVHSLVTTFGLDFLLMEDKRGGDVDTIHNVRKGIYATESEKQRYENRGVYDFHSYHSHKDYIENNNEISRIKKSGKLIDGYTGEKINVNGLVDQDHIVSAVEVHNDAGRVLAEIKGEDLANRKYNLTPTHRSLNRSKNANTANEFVNSLDKKINNKSKTLESLKDNLKKLEESEHHNHHKIMEVKKKISNAEVYIEEHQKLKNNSSKILEKDRISREKQDKEINDAYYKSAKFMKSAGLDMHKKGLAMGTRQVLGLVFAEIWFELREQIPQIYQRHQIQFKFECFLQDIKDTLHNIWLRIKVRFKDLLATFASSYLGGMIASLQTTILNIFLTTEKMIGKMIRELWNSLVGIIKLIFFNPDRLALGDLMKEAMRLLALGVSTLVGSYIHSHLNAFLQFPFGSEISAFISALTTGILNLGFVYFLEHSEITQKVWDFLNKFQMKSSIALSLEYVREVNAELDRYLIELTKIEFNLNTEELKQFANALTSANDEFERNFVLAQEVKSRNIQLGYETGNATSFRNFLKSKFQK